MTVIEKFTQIAKKNPEILRKTGVEIAELLGCKPSAARQAKQEYILSNRIKGEEFIIPDIEADGQYTESRDKDGSVKITDVVERRLSDEELFKRYNRSSKEWRISMIWFKDKSNGKVLLSCSFIPLQIYKSGEIEAIEQFKKELINHAPQYKPFVRTKNHNDPVMLEISMYDLHYGKLCWGAESGRDFDSAIAEKRYKTAARDFISRASHVYNIEKILFVIGNDFLNSEGKSNATTAGTPQDTDSRWKKMYVGGRKLIVSTIEELLAVAPVEVIGIEGNHAEQAEFYMTDAIECWFNKCKDVIVNNSPRARKYHLYGNSLLGFTHGHLEKSKDLPLLMASEVPDLWSKAIFREFHKGHFHHENEFTFNTAVENKTVVVRTLSSMSGTDAWHKGAGYVGAKQSAQAFVWGKKSGIENIYYHNIV